MENNNLNQQDVALDMGAMYDSNNNYSIPSLENIYHNDINSMQTQALNQFNQKPIPNIDYPNKLQQPIYNPNYIQGYNHQNLVNLNVGCNTNQIGAGSYRNYRKLYICTDNPNSPGMKMYEEIPLDDDVYYNNQVSEELIQTLINFLKVSGIGNIERCIDYNQLLKTEFKGMNRIEEMFINNTTVNASSNSVTAVSEELEYDDPIFGSYRDGRVENDDQYNYSPVRYQFYCNFDRDLYVYTRDKVFIPIAKKLFNKNPTGLKEYVCIVKTYDLNPNYLDKNTILKTVEHIAFNATRVKSIKNESEINKLKEICIKNSINYKNNNNDYLRPIRIRLITYVPEHELSQNGYKLYIKSLGMTISDKVANLNIDKVENPVDEGKFVSSIKILTDSSDHNNYYYKHNDKIITLPKTIDNTKESKIIIEEQVGSQSSKIEVNLDNAKEHEIYTDREELNSIISSNKNKAKELDNKWKELDVKEKELNVKEKEIEFKHFKVSEEKEQFTSTNAKTTGKIIENFAKSANSVLGVATAAVGLGLACWKLYTTIKGK